MAKLPFHIGSSLSVETSAGTLASRRRMELLAGIGTNRSIAAAAREIGLTYKAGWDAVETINNLAGTPLVERSVGGRGGGGARLTERGHELVKAFQAVSRENQRFIDSMNRRVGGKERDLQLLNRLSVVTSARNQLAGSVRRIEKGAVNDSVELTLPGGERIVAMITRESVRNLGLKAGSEVIALIKASSVIVAADDGAKLLLSARNQLTGQLTRVTRGAVNSEVVLEIAGGGTVAAIITNASVRELRLVRGRRVKAIFKASSVILAVTG